MNRGNVIGTLGIVVVLLASGCSQPTLSGVSLLGTVTLDGASLDRGTILFEPTSKPATGPARNAMAIIKDGAYQVPAGAGIQPGTYRVAISSIPQGGPTSTDPVKAMQEASKPAPADRIPAIYNVKSGLTAEVKASGPNKFDFSLKSR